MVYAVSDSPLFSKGEVKIDEFFQIELCCNSRTQNPFVLKALEYILNNLDTVKVMDVAQHMNTERATLRNKFKRYLGTTTERYILCLRLKHAVIALANTGLDVTSVCNNVGLCPTHFNGYLKRYTDLKPRDFKKLSAFSEREKILSQSVMKFFGLGEESI